MNAPTLEREKQDVDNPTLMIHWRHGVELVAFCGAKLRGIAFPDSETVDCHVCAEIAGQA